MFHQEYLLTYAESFPTVAHPTRLSLRRKTHAALLQRTQHARRQRGVACAAECAMLLCSQNTSLFSEPFVILATSMIASTVILVNNQKNV